MNNAKQYRAKNGRLQYKPAHGWLVEVMETDNATGYCLACGQDVDAIEPDAEHDTCPHCFASKVFGAENLMLRGLFYDEDLEEDRARARSEGWRV